MARLVEVDEIPKVASNAAKLVPAEPGIADKMGAAYKDAKDYVTSLPYVGGVIRGALDIPQGVTQLVAHGVNAVAPSLVSDADLAAYEGASKDSETRYQAARQARVPNTTASLITGEKEKPGIDWGRVAGGVATSLPLAGVTPAATLLGRAGQGAAIGGVMSVASPLEQYDNFALDKAKQAGIGAASGFVMTPVTEKALGAVGNAFNNRVLPRIKAITQKAEQQPERIEQTIRLELKNNGIDYDGLTQSVRDSLVSQAQKALRAGGKLNTAAVARQADFDALGIKPTTGQLTRDPIQWTWENNKRGAVDALAKRFNQQDAQLKDALTTITNGSGAAATPYEAGKKMISALQKYDSDISSQVTGAYNAARNATGATVNVPLQPVAQKFGEVLDTFGRENIPSAVASKLEAYGVIGGKQTKVFDLLEADKLLKVINANYDPAKRSEAAALNEIKRGLYDSINSIDDKAGGEAAEAFRTAVAMAKKRFQLLDRTPALDDAVNGSVAAEDFIKKHVINGKVDNINSLFGILENDAKQTARRQVLDGVQKRVFNKNTVENANFSAAGIKDALDTFGIDRARAVLDPAAFTRLQQMQRVSEAIALEPKGGYANRSNTAVEGWAGLGLLADKLSKIPGGNMVVKEIANAANNRQAGRALQGLLQTERAPVMNPQTVEQYIRMGGLLAPMATLPPLLKGSD